MPRGASVGLFYAGYGCGWLIGSVAMGLLYERSRVCLIMVGVLAQLASLPIFVMAQRRKSASR
jgi:predicted MFS family arabinose efflux permease